MGKWFQILAILTLVLFYQNCENPELQSMKGMQESDSPSFENVKMDKPLKALHMDRLDLGQDGFFRLEIDLDEDVISLFPSDGSSNPMTANLQNEDSLLIQDFFTSANLCQDEQPPQTDRLCTMEYVFPYAVLIMADDVHLALGEKTNGCDKPLDFCSSEKREDLYVILEDILRNYEITK